MTRVDTVPLLWRPLFYLYGWIFGLLLYVFSYTLHLTCRIRWEGSQLKQQPHYIFSIWHESLVPFFAVFIRMSDQVWMNHPAWYMKPIHVLLRLTGVQHICLGSSGNSGKEALANVITYLRDGYSTSLAVDGPAGPYHELKPGCLLMSRDTGTPVIALRFECSRHWRLNGWDRKVVPYPFSTITVSASEPWIVTDENMQECHDRITVWLNGAV